MTVLRSKSWIFSTRLVLQVWFEVLVPTAGTIPSMRYFFLEMTPSTAVPQSGARRFAAPALRALQGEVQCSARHFGEAFAVLTFSIQLPVALVQANWLGLT